MDESSNAVRLRQPDDVDDPMAEVLRFGARQLLARAVELEIEALLAERADLKLSDGRARLVRHGHGPEREVQTGIGAVAMSGPKVRERGATEGGERIPFTSAVLRRWARRTRSLNVLLPTLYLRERFLSQRVLDGYDAIVDACCQAWNALTPERLRSLILQPEAGKSFHECGGISRLNHHSASDGDLELRSLNQPVQPNS